MKSNGISPNDFHFQFSLHFNEARVNLISKPDNYIVLWMGLHLRLRGHLDYRLFRLISGVLKQHSHCFEILKSSLEKASVSLVGWIKYGVAVLR